MKFKFKNYTMEISNLLDKITIQNDSGDSIVLSKEILESFGFYHEESIFECARCGQSILGEPSYVTPPHPDDGMSDEYCAVCYCQEELFRIMDQSMM